MKILVVLLVVAATICRADDDDDDSGEDSGEEVTLRYVSVPSAITHARSAITHVPSAIAHGRSSSPAVMKIPKPGIRFDIPVPRTHGYAIPADKIVQVPSAVPMPVPNAIPIHYSAVSEVPHPFTYWGNFKTPQMMTNFMDLNTGRFSYMNVIGDISPGLGYTVPVPQANPWQDHPFKAFFDHRSL